MIAKKYLKSAAAMIAAVTVATAAMPCIGLANEEGFENKDRIVNYARFTGGRSQAWDKNMPFPLDKTPAYAGTPINVINDGSTEYPAESHLQLSEISEGNVVVMYDFSFDRRMDDTSFRLTGKGKSIFGIVTKGTGLYLEQANGKNLFMCSYKSGSTPDSLKYVVRAELDFNTKRIKSVQINGKTLAYDKPFASDAAVADSFDIKTSEKAIGVVTNWCLYIDGGYILEENFMTGSESVSDAWIVESNGGTVTLSENNSTLSERYFMTLDSEDGGVTALRKITPSNGKLTFEINVLTDEKRGGFKISTLSGEKALISLLSDSNSFCYTDENGNAIPFYEFIKNIWYNLKAELDTSSGTYDLYLNNRKILSNLKFANEGGFIDAVCIDSEKNKELLHIDDVMLYKTQAYSDDYPILKDIPEKKDNSTLVGMQLCPMWVEGTHFGWDWIAQSSDRREPVIGFYDGNSPESVDWIIKQMLEHGIDYMSVCMFPHIFNSNGSDRVSQITDKNPRSAGFLSAVLNSRYSDKIKYSIFLEANGITAGKNYYDDFFEVVWPHYIEHYFKDPRYLKVDGRPVFGVYASSNLFNVFDDGSGKASIRRGVEKMRQMCIDAGVGNPYLIVNDGNYSIDAAANSGFDAVSSYGLGYDATFTSQKNIFKQALDECVKKGVDFIVSPVPMRDDTAWRPQGGYWHTEEEFTRFLNWMNEDLLKNYKPSVSSKLANMCTWDEYGEGHIIAPTVGLGFQYVDAIRSAMTVGGEHSDDWPTESQRSRINKLYTNKRKIQNVIYETSSINRKVFYESREKTPDSKKPEDVKKAWTLTNASDIAAVVPVGNIASISGSAEGMIVQPSGTTPRIRIDIPDGIDVYDITYLRIRMKKNPTSGGGFVYWTSDISGGIDNDKKLFFNSGIDDGTNFVDYYAPVSSNVNWTGRVDKLEIMLGQISDVSQPFVVEKIELLQDTEIDLKDKVIIDGRIQDLTDGFEESDGTLMLPLREVLYMAGADEILAYQSDNTYTIKYNDEISCVTENSRKAKINGEDVFLSSEPYRKSELVNDTVYIPLDFAEAVMKDKEFNWDSESRTLIITSAEEDDDDVGREVIYSIDYDDESSIANPNGITGITFSDGKMKATTSNNDPNFAASVNIDASAVKFIRIKVNTPSSQRFKFYFITNKDSRWGENKGSSIVTTSAGNNTLMFDTSMIGTWADTITTFRIDPAVTAGAEFTMDQVTFYGEEIAPSDTSGRSVDMSSCVSVSNKAYEWKFNKNTDFDGWEPNKALGNVKTDGGKLSAVITGNKPMLVNRNNINLDTKTIDSIVLKYANKTNSKKLKVYFLTDKDSSISEEKCFEIDVYPMSENSDEYQIDVSKNENWNGILKKLIISPYNGAIGKIEIDNIGLKLKEEKMQ